MPETTKYGIIGAGKVGLSIAELLFAKGKLSFIYDINPSSIPKEYEHLSFGSLSELPQTDFIYIAIADWLIIQLAEEIKKHYRYVNTTLFAHSSGVKSALDLSALNDVSFGIASIHPFQTFAYADKENLKGIAWGIECREENSSNCIEFVRELEGKYFQLKFGNRNQKILYHCSAVMSSNNMTTLLQAGKLIADKSGIPAKDFIDPITQKTLDNNINAFQNSTIPLTGPIARADAEAINQHLDALEDKSLIRIYCYSALATLELSLREHIIDKETYLRIRNLLNHRLKD